MAAPQKSILIIEDEKPLAHALELKLQKSGCQVTVARNGQEGLDLLDRSQFTAVLLDLMMPIVDGFQVLEHIKTLEHKPTTFVLSNLSQAEDEQRVIALGAKKYFVKSDTPLAVIVNEINKLA